MASNFKYLFTPIKVGPLTLKNRIVNGPHSTEYASKHVYDEREFYYRLERAKGGAAMVCGGIQEVDPRLLPSVPGGRVPNMDDTIIPWYRRFSDACHEYGAKFIPQLGDDGGIIGTKERPHQVPPMAASPIASDVSKNVPMEISRQQLEEIAKLFGTAAARCTAGGCDGVLIHAAHGELLMSFYSPAYNVRTDEFGGSMGNRIKPLLMVINEVRENMGPNMALGVRISADEWMEGGVTIKEAKEVANLLDKSGKVDWLDISTGNISSYLSWGTRCCPMALPPGCFVPLAAEIRSVVNIPVVAVGGITDPIHAEKILSDGHADLICMVRGLIADPYLPNKAKAGQLEDIRRCVRIHDSCYGHVTLREALGCTQNANVGREKEWSELKPAAVKKKVMIIGGGPAGLEAARVAVLRGHKVALHEKEAELGGQVLIAVKAPSRAELAGIVSWLSLQVKKRGVDIHLNSEVTPELVLKENPDVVVVATGSNPTKLNIPGANDNNLMNERDVLLGKKDVGQRVVVLDGTGDMNCCSTAEYLADKGKQVCVLAKGYQVGENIDGLSKPLTYRNLLQKGVVLMPFMWIRSISNKTVMIYNTFTYQEDKIENIDTVVSAMLSVSENHLYKLLEGKVKVLYAIGDCVAPRWIKHAIYEGSKVGREL